MWSRRAREQADIQEWSDVAVWLYDVIESVSPSEADDVDETPLDEAAGAA